MAKKHLKRLIIPKTWNIKKKGIKYVMRPNPGSHPMEFGMPLALILRDVIRTAASQREVKKILLNKAVHVDGKERIEPKFIAGLMDVISFPKLKKHYRIILDPKCRLDAIEIPENEAKLRISRIIGKKPLKKGKIQLNLSDGRNLDAEKGEYRIG
ncbi:30S ribosomal protein S4e, partial [Candidatus Woesearchaeota archaeon]|nr:30S ribosomal protein S4e [Candidatus Woesearchaeota archaeon]